MTASNQSEEEGGSRLARLNAALEQAGAEGPDTAIACAVAELCGSVADIALLHYIGVAFHESGDLAVAERVLDLALARDPAFMPSRIELGAVHTAAGRNADARRTYEQAVLLPGAPAYVFARLAGIIAAEGQLFQARLLLTAALADEPGHPQWQQDLMKVERQLLQRLI